MTASADSDFQAMILCFISVFLSLCWFVLPNMWVSRQFRRLSRVLAGKSGFVSILRNCPPTREFSFLYAAKLPSCTTIVVAESQHLKPQMQTVLSGRAVMATPIFTTFFETSPAVSRGLGKGGWG